MKNENNQNASGSHKDEKGHNEEIPLWLQGLQEHADEDTNPIEIEKPSVETWAGDLPVETPAPKNTPLEDQIETKGKTTEGNTHPDWLSELADIDPTKPPVLDQREEAPASSESEEVKESRVVGEEPEEIELAQVPSQDIPKVVDEAFKGLPPAGEEIELREPEEIKEPHKDQSAVDQEHGIEQSAEVEITEAEEEMRLEESQPQDEDLPPWLQEMIAESQEPDQTLSKQEEIQKAAMLADEPTEPIEVKDEPPPQEEPEAYKEIVEEIEFEQQEVDVEVNEGSEEIQVIEEFEVSEQEITPEPPPSEWVPEQAVGSGIDFENEPLPHETPATSIEGDTHPAEITESGSEEDAPALEEQPEGLSESDLNQLEQEGEISESLPEDLLRAKEMLLSGEIDQALSLIRASSEQSAYRGEIKTWLVDASQALEKPHVDFWELVGDLALEEKQPELALNAYSNAIQSLIKKNEE